MHKILLLGFLFSLCAPAFAVYKCESNGKTTYTDEPCRHGKLIELDTPLTGLEPLPQDMAHARQEAARQKNELIRIENERQRREASEEKEYQKLARANAAKRKKCAALALQTKWAEEDAAAAIGKSVDKVRRNARRKAEKFEMECGK